MVSGTSDWRRTRVPRKLAQAHRRPGLRRGPRRVAQARRKPRRPQEERDQPADREAEGKRRRLLAPPAPPPLPPVVLPALPTIQAPAALPDLAGHQGPAAEERTQAASVLNDGMGRKHNRQLRWHGVTIPSVEVVPGLWARVDVTEPAESLPEIGEKQKLGSGGVRARASPVRDPRLRREIRKTNALSASLLVIQATIRDTRHQTPARSPGFQA